MSLTSTSCFYLSIFPFKWTEDGRTIEQKEYKRKGKRKRKEGKDIKKRVEADEEIKDLGEGYEMCRMFYPRSRFSPQVKSNQ